MSKVFLFHQDHPAGQIFDAEHVSRNQESLSDDGWVDTPSKLDLPEPLLVQVSMDELKESTPEDVIGMVKNMGYHVFNDIELAQLKSSITAEVTEQLKAEDGGDDKLELNLLYDKFVQLPESLTKQELIVLASGYSVKLSMTMKEATMIGHINEAMAS